ncbi:MAG: hypothetical protein A2015_09205 [Spirochaetes bacterium GWF1_31_7]|nr:MAG: hypothetical protein A2Y30_09015 [Spirochaetes bacterium GWE1_32_154]OHD44874.1 MAG: hypothetical protein A2Y29_09365 [Spirochaetes bacterium GWE2_31_10]OHD47665.1 MAG: hypothetical protein A2015_09205 [Spirochaetes bacterium GWF1_31_7]OHD77938.1 MAG: hypothetical protein A2355_04240 [Spirochaetes bacterium RIFOXYB1_FULL_32_8]HBD94865.1 hypothetical protein [Spirochaetia bacterium]
MKEKIKSNEFLVIENAIKSILIENNFVLIDMDITLGKDALIVLYVFNEKKDIDSMAKLNDKIYETLEKINFLKDGFSLEISSPGINRKIKFISEFEIFKELELKIMLNNDDMIVGKSEGIKDSKLVITNDNETLLLDIDNIKKAALNG